MVRREVIVEKVRYLSAYYDKVLSVEKAQIYYEFLERFSEQEINTLVKLCIAKFKYFPMISELRDEISVLRNGKPLDERDVAYDMAGAIIEAISRFGYTGEAEAYRHLGAEAQYAIERFGGWRELCQTQVDNLSIVRAQLRDICKATISTKAMANDNVRRLTMSFQKEGAKRLGELIQFEKHKQIS
jgi:hypothetical protein